MHYVCKLGNRWYSHKYIFQFVLNFVSNIKKKTRKNTQGHMEFEIIHKTKVLNFLIFMKILNIIYPNLGLADQQFWLTQIHPDFLLVITNYSPPNYCNLMFEQKVRRSKTVTCLTLHLLIRVTVITLT